MYFSPPQMEAIVARLAHSLAPGGFPFLGHAETLRGLSEAFHLHHTHGTFYYERLGRRASAAARRGGGQVGSGSDATDRAVRRRMGRHDPRRDGTRSPADGTPGRGGRRSAAGTKAPDLASALDLLGQERFADALVHVAGLRTGREGDPDLLLVEAVLQAHGGGFAAAEKTARQLLEIDELNAGAHYVLALCAEQGGDTDEAAEHDRVATYLDPGFAMPRLHLGLLAKFAGNRDAARRELAQARLLLRREDASRLLLFGGGFGREALMALCDTALRDRGGGP